MMPKKSAASLRGPMTLAVACGPPSMVITEPAAVVGGVVGPPAWRRPVRTKAGWPGPE